MKKMFKVFLGMILALVLAGAGYAADPPAPGQTQAVCPVMGGKIDPNIYADYQGQRIYFCCPACLEFFQNPQKYLKKQEKQR